MPEPLEHLPGLVGTNRRFGRFPPSEYSPVEERIKDYIEQIKNPYCYLCNGVVEKISFAGKKRLDDCLSSYIQFAGGNTLADILTVGKEAS